MFFKLSLGLTPRKVQTYDYNKSICNFVLIHGKGGFNDFQKH